MELRPEFGSRNLRYWWCYVGQMKTSLISVRALANFSQLGNHKYYASQENDIRKD